MRDDAIAIAETTMQAKKLAEALQSCRQLVKMIDEQGVVALQHHEGRELFERVKRDLGVKG